MSKKIKKTKKTTSYSYLSANTRYRKAIEYIKHNYCSSTGSSYLILGNVCELVDMLIGKKPNLENLTLKEKSYLDEVDVDRYKAYVELGQLNVDDDTRRKINSIVNRILK